MKKLLVILLVLGLAAPAMAADWNFYASSRLILSWDDVSTEFYEPSRRLSRFTDT